MTPATAEHAGLTLEIQDRIATLTVCRPDVRNAFTTSMWVRLRDTARALAGRDDVRVLVIAGAGGAFTSGSDLRELAERGPDGAEESFALMEEALTAVESLPIATVARIHGPALGAGLELALACDLRVSSRRALYGMPIARLGITVSSRFAARLVRVAGVGVAKDLILTGRFLTAREAYRRGLVHYLVRVEELEPFTQALARQLALQSPASIRAAKAAIQRLLPLPEERGVRYTDPETFVEGVRAFLERREPRF